MSAIASSDKHCTARIIERRDLSEGFHVRRGLFHTGEGRRPSSVTWSICYGAHFA